MDLQHLHFHRIKYYIYCFYFCSKQVIYTYMLVCYYMHRTTNLLAEISVIGSNTSSWYLYKSGSHICEEINDFVYNSMPGHRQLIKPTIENVTFQAQLQVLFIFFFLLLIILSNCLFVYRQRSSFNNKVI